MALDCFVVPSSSSLIRISVEEAARRNADIVVPFDWFIDDFNSFIKDSGLCKEDGKEIQVLTIQEFQEQESDNQQNLVIVSPECILKEILGDNREYVFIRV